MTGSLIANVLFAALLSGATADTRDASSIRRFDPAASTPTMAAWVIEHIGQQTDRTSPSQKAALVNLGQLLLGPRGLDLEESIGTTPTAAEAFLGRSANCLGLAHLAVALGRRAGLDLVYVETKTGPVVERSASLRVEHRHAAVALIGNGDALMLDFGGARHQALDSLRILSDHQARGFFYANRGGEKLISGEPAAALPWLEAAIELVDEAWLWRNLALAWMRTGRPAAATVARDRARALEASAAVESSSRGQSMR